MKLLLILLAFVALLSSVVAMPPPAPQHEAVGSAAVVGGLGILALIGMSVTRKHRTSASEHRPDAEDILNSSTDSSTDSSLDPAHYIFAPDPEQVLSPTGTSIPETYAAFDVSPTMRSVDALPPLSSYSPILDTDLTQPSHLSDISGEKPRTVDWKEKLYKTWLLLCDSLGMIRAQLNHAFTVSKDPRMEATCQLIGLVLRYFVPLTGLISLVTYIGRRAMPYVWPRLLWLGQEVALHGQRAAVYLGASVIAFGTWIEENGERLVRKVLRDLFLMATYTFCVGSERLTIAITNFCFNYAIRRDEHKNRHRRYVSPEFYCEIEANMVTSSNAFDTAHIALDKTKSFEAQLNDIRLSVGGISTTVRNLSNQQSEVIASGKAGQEHYKAARKAYDDAAYHNETRDAEQMKALMDGVKDSVIGERFTGINRRMNTFEDSLKLLDDRPRREDEDFKRLRQTEDRLTKAADYEDLKAVQDDILNVTTGLNALPTSDVTNNLRQEITKVTELVSARPKKEDLTGIQQTVTGLQRDLNGFVKTEDFNQVCKDYSNLQKNHQRLLFVVELITQGMNPQFNLAFHATMAGQDPSVAFQMFMQNMTQQAKTAPTQGPLKSSESSSAGKPQPAPPTASAPVPLTPAPSVPISSKAQPAATKAQSVATKDQAAATKAQPAAPKAQPAPAKIQPATSKNQAAATASNRVAQGPQQNKTTGPSSKPSVMPTEKPAAKTAVKQPASPTPHANTKAPEPAKQQKQADGLQGSLTPQTSTINSTPQTTKESTGNVNPLTSKAAFTPQSAEGSASSISSNNKTALTTTTTTSVAHKQAAIRLFEQDFPGSKLDLETDPWIPHKNSWLVAFVYSFESKFIFDTAGLEDLKKTLASDSCTAELRNRGLSPKTDDFSKQAEVLKIVVNHWARQTEQQDPIHIGYIVESSGPRSPVCLFDATIIETQDPDKYRVVWLHYNDAENDSPNDRKDAIRVNKGNSTRLKNRWSGINVAELDIGDDDIKIEDGSVPVTSESKKQPPSEPNGPKPGSGKQNPQNDAGSKLPAKESNESQHSTEPEATRPAPGSQNATVKTKELPFKDVTLPPLQPLQPGVLSSSYEATPTMTTTTNFGSLLQQHVAPINRQDTKHTTSSSDHPMVTYVLDQKDEFEKVFPTTPECLNNARIDKKNALQAVIDSLSHQHTGLQKPTLQGMANVCQDLGQDLRSFTPEILCQSLVKFYTSLDPPSNMFLGSWRHVGSEDEDYTIYQPVNFEGTAKVVWVHEDSTTGVTPRWHGLCRPTAEAKSQEPKEKLPGPASEPGDNAASRAKPPTTSPATTSEPGESIQAPKTSDKVESTSTDSKKSHPVPTGTQPVTSNVIPKVVPPKVDIAKAAASSPADLASVPSFTSTQSQQQTSAETSIGPSSSNLVGQNAFADSRANASDPPRKDSITKPPPSVVLPTPNELPTSALTSNDEVMTEAPPSERPTAETPPPAALPAPIGLPASTVTSNDEAMTEAPPAGPPTTEVTPPVNAAAPESRSQDESTFSSNFGSLAFSFAKQNPFNTETVAPSAPTREELMTEAPAPTIPTPPDSPGSRTQNQNPLILSSSFAPSAFTFGEPDPLRSANDSVTGSVNDKEMKDVPVSVNASVQIAVDPRLPPATVQSLGTTASGLEYNDPSNFNSSSTGPSLRLPTAPAQPVDQSYGRRYNGVDPTVENFNVTSGDVTNGPQAQPAQDADRHRALFKTDFFLSGLNHVLAWNDAHPDPPSVEEPERYLKRQGAEFGAIPEVEASDAPMVEDAGGPERRKIIPKRPSSIRQRLQRETAAQGKSYAPPKHPVPPPMPASRFASSQSEKVSMTPNLTGEHLFNYKADPADTGRLLAEDRNLPASPAASEESEADDNDTTRFQFIAGHPAYNTKLYSSSSTTTPQVYQSWKQPPKYPHLGPNTKQPVNPPTPTYPNSDTPMTKPASAAPPGQSLSYTPAQTRQSSISSGFVDNEDPAPFKAYGSGDTFLPTMTAATTIAEPELADPFAGWVPTNEDQPWVQQPVEDYTINFDNIDSGAGSDQTPTEGTAQMGTNNGGSGPDLVHQRLFRERQPDDTNRYELPDYLDPAILLEKSENEGDISDAEQYQEEIKGLMGKVKIPGLFMMGPE